MKFLSVLAISLFVMVILPYYIHINAYQHGENYVFKYFSYSMQNSYRSSADLFGVLAHKVSSMHQLFDWCCDCMLYYARLTHLSYEEANIYLFIIWQPYLIALFAYLWVTQYRKNTKIRTVYPLSRPSKSLAF